MYYRKIINGRHLFAWAVEIFVESAEEDGFISGGHTGFFLWDQPVARESPIFVKDDDGRPKLFADPMDAIGAAFVLATEGSDQAEA